MSNNNANARDEIIEAGRKYYPTLSYELYDQLNGRVPPVRFVIDDEGPAPGYFNSRTRELHLCLGQIADVFADAPDTPLYHDGAVDEPMLLSCMEYLLGHEAGHALYTGGESYAWAISKSADLVTEWLYRDLLGKTRFFRNKNDYMIALRQIADTTGVYVTRDQLEEIGAFLANSMEDGRQERICAGASARFAKLRKVWRHAAWCHEDNFSCTDKSASEKLRVIMNDTLVLATSGVHERGFTMAFAGKPLYDEMHEYIPYITEAYIAPTTKGLAEAQFKLVEKMYPTIKDALLEASKNNATAEALAEMLAELVRSVMSGDADYGNDKHALEDSDRSMNSAFGKSDLTIVLPDDVYDALVKQQRENGESGDGGVRIMREHPLPQDADSSASEDSASGQSGADSNGASGGGASGAEENFGAESASSNGAQGADSDADRAQSTSGASGASASDTGAKDDAGANGAGASSISAGDDSADDSGAAGSGAETADSASDETADGAGNGEGAGADDAHSASSASSDGADNGANNSACDGAGSNKGAIKPVDGKCANEGPASRKNGGGELDEFDDADAKALRDEITSAAAEVRADADRLISAVNAAASESRTVPTKHTAQREVKDGAPTVKQSDVAEIMRGEKFREVKHGDYAHTVDLPAELKKRGETLAKVVDRYFKGQNQPHVRNMRSGLIDGRRLTRLARNDVRVFQKKGVDKPGDTAVYILIDDSGSMCGAKTEAAFCAAAVQEEGFKAHIPLKIVSFTTRTGIIHKVIKGWDEQHAWNCCFNFLRHHDAIQYGNDDNYDIRIATKELLQRPEKNRILIVLSDGTPSDVEDTKAAIDEARKRGVKVAGIYFEYGEIGMEANDFRHMYQRDYVCCTTDEIDKNLSMILKAFALH